MRDLLRLAPQGPSSNGRRRLPPALSPNRPVSKGLTSRGRRAGTGPHGDTGLSSGAGPHGDTGLSSGTGPRASRAPLAGSGAVRLTVHDAGGRLVRVLDEGWRAAGQYRVEWDGCGDNGARVETGVYYVCLDSAAGRSTRSVVVAE